MRFLLRFLCVSVMVAVVATDSPSIFAQDEEISMEEAMRRFEASLVPQSGDVVLPGEIATLYLSEEFRYLTPESTSRVLEDAWGNPPGSETLGMIYPVNAGILTDEGWGVVISFSDDGYVSDEDAEGIDYDELLSNLQDGILEGNADREEQGYSTYELVGWAAPPRYDMQNKKLYWAQELAFVGSPDHTLNYNIRVLGRRGVLVLNAVASVSQMATVERDMQQVIAQVDFNPGHGYADYEEGTDKIAEYGLGALILGGVAAKAGIFKWLLALILAGKKFVFIGVVALIALLRKLFAGRSKEAAVSDTTD